MEKEEFINLAKEKFGDKINYNSLQIDDETEKSLKEQKIINNKEEVKNYKNLWLVDQDRCPHCGSDLLGLFGSFTWGIAHGEGFCSNCKKVNFTYYHYFYNGGMPLMLFAISGFNKDI